MRVKTDVDYADVDGDYGTVEGLCVTCTRCGHYVEVGGTEEAPRVAVRSCFERNALEARVIFMW